MTIYVRAGLYAEGPSDDDFLSRLLDRLLPELLRQHFPAQYEFRETVLLQIDLSVTSGRDRRIAAAIHEYWSTCTLYVIHSDGKSDPDRERARTIDPGVALARERWQADTDTAGLPLAIAACVPVREMEAWLLTDPVVFDRLGLRGFELPLQPDRVTDPKEPLAALLKPLDLHRRPPFEFFGEQISLAALRKLEGFRAFESELLAALHQLAP